MANSLFEYGRVHSLREHLEGTVKLTAEFTGEFGCDKWWRLAGLWHQNICIDNTYGVAERWNLS